MTRVLDRYVPGMRDPDAQAEAYIKASKWATYQGVDRIAALLVDRGRRVAARGRGRRIRGDDREFVGAEPSAFATAPARVQ